MTNHTEIIESFKQGKTGNCVSIAVIKAAIGQFGIDSVFRSVNKETSQFKIVMRDGFKTTLRNHEIEKSARFSRFNKGLNDEIRSKAHFYFAAMAKRVYVEGKIDVFLGRRTLRGALRSLNNGENYREGIEWLGLNENCHDINLNQISSFHNVVGASSKHCFYIGGGNLVDIYGKPTLIEEIGDREFFDTKYLVALS